MQRQRICGIHLQHQPPYGRELCSPHTVKEKQLDELVVSELKDWQSRIVSESERYDKIVKDWLKKKPIYEMQIAQHQKRITALHLQIEDLIIERMSDKEHREVFNSMIEKRETEIAEFEKTVSSLREYDKVCKARRAQLSDTAEMLKDVLGNGRISDISLRMLVKWVSVHQNENKSLDITFEMNGDFEASTAAFIDPPEYETDDPSLVEV